MKGRSARRI